MLSSARRTFLKTLDDSPQCLMELEQRAYYVINEYSDKETMRNLDAARNRVIAYLEQIMTASPADDRLLTILDNKPAKRIENSWPSFTFFSRVMAFGILVMLLSIPLNIVIGARLPIADRTGTEDREWSLHILNRS
mgnify:CR=1 FL=1